MSDNIDLQAIIELEIQKAQLKFIEEVSKNIQEINDYLHTLDYKVNDLEQIIDEIHQFLHKLYGRAATFGFKTISDQSKSTLEVCESLKGKNNNHSPAKIKRLKSQLKVLSEIMSKEVVNGS